MVEIQQRGSAFALAFTEAEAQRLGLDREKEYELTKVRNGIWVLVEGKKAGEAAGISDGQKVALATPGKNTEQPKGHAQPQATAVDETEQKIMGMLRKTPARDRMEGWFEKKLSEPEKKKFVEMLASGKVIKFKSSEVFRKSLYTLPQKSGQKQPEEKRFDNREKPIEEFSLEKDGFLVVRNEARAKSLSAELQENIKSGEIKGTRAFSGEFFIIRSGLLIKSQEKVLSELKKAKSASLAELASKTGMTPTLIRIAAVFLSEEGQIIEKRKEQYKYIE